MAFDVSYIIQATDQFSGNLKKFQSEMGAVARKAKTVSDRMSSMSKGMQKWGRGISMKLGAPIAALGTVAIRTTNSFEKSMNMLQAVTGATGKQFDALKDKAMELGMTTRFTARDAAQGMVQLALAGREPAQILKEITPNMQAAASAQLEIGQATKIVTNIQGAYAIKAKKLNDLNDMLAVSFSKSKTDLGLLGDGFKALGPTAHLAGIPIKESTAVLSMLSNTSLAGAQGAYGFRRAILKMQAPVGMGAKVVKELNLQFVDAKGKMLPLLPLFQRLEKLKELNILKPAGFQALFGIFGGTAMSAAVGRGSDEMRYYLKLLDEAKGTSKRMAETQMQGLPGALWRLQAALEHVQIAVVGANNSLLILGVNTLSKVILKISQLSPATRRWIGEIGALAIAAGPVLLILGKFVGVLVILGRITFITALLAGSIVTAVMALGVAFAYLYMHSKRFRNVIKDIGHILYTTFIRPFERAFNIAKKLFALVGRHTGFAAPGVAPGAAPSRFPVGAVSPLAFTPGAAHIPSVTQMVKSALNIRVQDDNKIIKSITGESDADDFGMNLGTNMALAR